MRNGSGQLTLDSILWCFAASSDFSAARVLCVNLEATAAEGNADHSPHNTQEEVVIEEEQEEKEQVRMLMLRVGMGTTHHITRKRRALLRRRRRSR